MDILNLPFMKVLYVKEDDIYYITAEMIERPDHCPHCASLQPKLVGQR